MVSIIKTTPSSIILQVGDKTIKALGESFARGFGSPDFIIDVSSIKTWDKLDDSIAVTEDERKFILQYLLDELTRRSWIVIAK